MSQPSFAERLRYLRERNGLTQRELAARLEVDRTAIVHWEAGRSKPRDIEALAAALGHTMASFYGARIPSKEKRAA